MAFQVNLAGNDVRLELDKTWLELPLFSPLIISMPRYPKISLRMNGALRPTGANRTLIHRITICCLTIRLRQGWSRNCFHMTANHSCLIPAVRRRGLEPRTYWLRVSSSTIELAAHVKEHELKFGFLALYHWANFPKFGGKYGIRTRNLSFHIR